MQIILWLVFFTLLFVWFCWLIFRSDKSSGSSSYKLSRPVVKFPVLRIPSSSVSKDNIVSFSSAEKRLRGACLGDSVKAARLIDYEVKRSMGLSSRSDAALAALDRLERDRSR